MKNSDDLVSVIMSTYNSQEKLAKSIESIINQSYAEMELLIVDDNSSDKTYEILKEYSSTHSNIKIFKNSMNIGLTKSLNYLITKASGNFIARQDDDDESDLNRISQQVLKMKQYDLDFSTTRAKIMGSKKSIPGISYYFPTKSLMRYKNPFIHGTLLIKKSVLIEIGGYDENFYYSQDYKLMKDLLAKGYRYKYLNEYLYVLNTQDNISKTKTAEQRYYANCVKKNLQPKLIK